MSTDKKVCLNTTGYEFIKINSPESIALNIEEFLSKKISLGQFIFQLKVLILTLQEMKKTLDL